jgi:hypothetical protein
MAAFRYPPKVWPFIETNHSREMIKKQASMESAEDCGD